LKRAVPDPPDEPNITAKPSKSNKKSRISKYFQEIPRKSKQKNPDSPFSFSKSFLSQTIPSFQPPLNIAKFFKDLQDPPKIFRKIRTTKKNPRNIHKNPRSQR
jgi:hypothetical protein